MTPCGVVVAHKPPGLSSARVVDVARRRLGTHEVGHCGTLDPLAEGVLVLCVGRARRVQGLLMEREKAYRAVVQLGAVSCTDDAEGPLESRRVSEPPDEAMVVATLATQVGRIQQRPPTFSAVKAEGRRAWREARRGRPVDLAPREVVIHELLLRSYRYPQLEVEVRCGRGTYIRSLARDVGEQLGTGGYLASLVRTRACGLGLEEAHPPEELGLEHVLPLSLVLQEEPRVDLEAGQLEPLQQGKVIPCEGVPQLPDGAPLFAWVEGQVVAWVRTLPDAVQTRRLLLPSGTYLD